MNDESQKTVAVIIADLDRSVLGTQSRLAEALLGQPVLQHTIARLKQVPILDSIIVFSPLGQANKLADIISSTAPTVTTNAATKHVELVELKQAIPPSLAIQKRKWSLCSWRGGLGDAVCFDELLFTAEMVDLLKQSSVDTVVMAQAGAVLIDPNLLTGLIEHHHKHYHEMRFTFTLASPGLAAVAYRVDLASELANTHTQIGDILRYQPNRPRADYLNDACVFKVDTKWHRYPFRFLTDTHRSFQAIQRAMNRVGKDDTLAIVHAIEQEDSNAYELPRELEIEINTEPTCRLVDYPHNKLRCSRGPMQLSEFKKIMADCVGYDDICITISGFGEPLAHRELPAMVDIAKKAGILGINIETDGRLLDGGLAEKLLDSPVDVISVWLDADSSNVYQQIKGHDDFDRVVQNCQAFAEKRQSRPQGALLVPHMVKTRQTIAEMEAFYDRWIRCCGQAVIVGYNDFAGQIPDHAVMDMQPPQRRPCKRLCQRMTILADSNVTICSQDFSARHIVGNATKESITDIYRSQKLRYLRQAHQKQQYDTNDLCKNCKEWHR